jgi:hypothetical protein
VSRKFRRIINGIIALHLIDSFLDGKVSGNFPTEIAERCLILFNTNKTEITNFVAKQNIENLTNYIARKTVTLIREHIREMNLSENEILDLIEKCELCNKVVWSGTKEEIENYIDDLAEIFRVNRLDLVPLEGSNADGIQELVNQYKTEYCNFLDQKKPKTMA